MSNATRTALLLGLAILSPCSASAQEAQATFEQAYFWTGVDAEGEHEPAEVERQVGEELADVLVSLDVHRDFAGVLARLRDLRVRASGATEANRMALLAEVALAEARVLQRMGRFQEAQAALERLLVDQETRERLRGWSFEVADKAARIAEAKKLRDPRIVRLRELLGRGQQADPGAEGAEGTQGIEQVVRQAFEIGNPALVYDIGPRAVPALEQLILADPNQFPSEAERDPLVALLAISELRGAALIERNYEAGSFFWKKRIVRAMEQADVLTNEGTWQETPDPEAAPRLLESAWLPLLGRMVHDPQIGRDAIRLVEPVAFNDALSPELQEGLILALRSPDPDMVREVLRVLRGTEGKRSVEPVLVAALEHPDREVRRFAAEQLLNYDPSPGLLSAADSPDPLVRRLAAKAMRKREVQRPSYPHDHPRWDEVEPEPGEAVRAALLGLLQDPDASVRREAMQTLVLAPRGSVDAELWTALAGDPDPRVRAMAVRLAVPDEAIEVEVLTKLAADPDPAVLRAVDLRLSGLAQTRDAERRIEPYLPVLAQRRADPVAPMSANLDAHDLEQVYAAAVGSDAGLRLAVRWALDEGDHELLLLLVERAAWQEQDAFGANVGMGCLSDEDLAAVLRTSFELSGKHFSHALGELTKLRPRRDRAMLALAGDPSAPRELRLAALQVAAGGGGPELERELRALLHDPSWKERAASESEASMLRRIGEGLPAGERAGIALRTATDPEVPSPVGLRLAGGIARDGGFDAEAARAVLERWYRDPEATFVVGVALESVQAEPGDACSALLREAVRHPAYYGKAIEAMGRLGHAEYVPVLGACLRADWMRPGGERVRAQYLAIEALVGYLDDRAADVLLEGLGWIQDEDTRQACFSALDTIRRYQEEREAWNARKLRQAAREQAVEELLVMLDSESWLTRANAVRSLATLGAIEHMPRIVRMLEDENEAVSDAARQALETLGSVGARSSAPEEE